MASLTKHDGLTTIQVVGLDGKRRSVRLGRVSDRDGQRIHAHIEELATAQRYSRPLIPETEAWLLKIGVELRARLEKAGLVDSPKPKAAILTLGSFLDSFIAARSTIKASTLVTYENVRRNLLRHFGADRSLDSITPGEGVSLPYSWPPRPPREKAWPTTRSGVVLALPGRFSVMP